MEPETSAPRPSQEMAPISRGNEHASFSGTEQQQPRTYEHAPRTAESRESLPAPASGDPAFVSQQPPAAPYVPPAQPSATASAPVATDDNTIAAADEDLIEKEWVDRAKKIISQTRSDPFLQEQEVSKLQADYLKKRYGKEIKLPTE